MNKFTKILVVLIISMTGLFALTACNPVLSIKPEFSYSSIEIELGETISTDIADYIDLDKLSESEKDFVLKNTSIEFNGTSGEGQLNGVGEYTLVIKYCGQQYKKYNIHVKDTVPPTINSKGNLYTFKTLELEDKDIKRIFSASDNSGHVVLTVECPKIDYNKAGEYTVTATASDPSGNTASAKAKLIVQEPKYGAPGTYVYVDISSQTVTYFEKSKVKLTSPVVTGCVANGNSTPKGIYQVTGMGRNVTLKGADYESHVDYWIAFIGSSIGMHDASWRSSFGGDIYQYNGSHGCVNMPYDAVARMYDLVSVGTIVIVN